MSRQQIVQDGTRHAAGRGAAHGLERRPIVAFGVLVGPDDTPLHLWAGLAQRVVPAVWFSCTIVLALRLRRQGA
jgi:hypothetical protein